MLRWFRRYSGFSPGTVVPYASASLKRLPREMLDCPRSTALRKEVESPVRSATSASDNPCPIRRACRRWPRCTSLSSASGAFDLSALPSSRRIAAVFSRSTRRRSLIRRNRTRSSFAHGKKSNQEWLQQETYTEVRAVYHLPAQMACNVPRQVGATYKALWTKVKQNAQARKQGITKKRYKGLDHPPQYVAPTLTYNYHRDYSLKEDSQVSILTLSGRVIVPYTGYRKHLALMQHGAHIGAAKLWYDKPRKQFY